MNLGDAPRPVTGLMSQTARHVMRKDSSLPELSRGASRAPRGPRVDGLASTTGSLRTAAGKMLGSASESALGRSSSNGRPSTVARRENSRRDFFHQQLQRQAEETHAADGPQSVGLVNSGSLNRRDSVDALAETFGRDMRGVTDRLEDLVRNLRFEDLKSKQEKEERKRREEELLLEEKRKATRKKELAASDPRKKVAIRIENFRRDFPLDSPDFPGNAIPMCPVQVEGPLGPETVTLVDVEGLRSRCLPISGAPNIEDLLKQRQERHRRTRNSAATSPRQGEKAPLELQALTPRSPGVKSCVSGMSFGLSSQTFSSLSWEDRRRQANAKRQASKVEAILRKLCSMRCLPMDMHIDFASLQACLDYERLTGPLNDIESLQSVVAVKLNGFIDSLANKLALDPDSENTALLKSLGKLSMSATGEQLNTSQRLLGLMPSPQATNSADDHLAKLARRWRVRRSMAIVRATSRWVMVLRGVRRRDHNIEVIKATMSQLGEWARVKSAMKRAVSSVRNIQQNCRRFLALKRDRCRQIEKDWERFEDANLELFYERFNRRLLKQKLEKAGLTDKRKGKRGMYKQMLKAQGQNLALNWKAFRIPASERAKLISAYYMSQLRNKVKTTAGVLNTVRMVLAKHRELNGFMSFFGGSASAQESFATAPKTQNWWSISEDVVIYLVGLAAQSLKAKEVSPFEDHPVFKDLPRNTMFVKQQMDFAAALAEGDEAVDLAMIRLVQRSCWKHLYKEEASHSSSDTKDASKPPSAGGGSSPAHSRRLQRFMTNDSLASEEAPAPNLEDVFAAFTPRLRAIHEEQLLEYRIQYPRPTSSERESIVANIL